MRNIRVSRRGVLLAKTFGLFSIIAPTSVKRAFAEEAAELRSRRIVLTCTTFCREQLA